MLVCCKTKKAFEKAFETEYNHFMKLSFFLSFLMVATLPAWAQYPTIPDSTKTRGAQQQVLWDSLDDVAWQKAVPTVMHDMLNGKPFVPWCASPEMLKQAPIPAFPGAIGGGRYSFGGRGGKVFVVTSLADSGPGTLRDHFLIFIMSIA